MDEDFVVIEWPDSQELMDQEWFSECILINTEEGIIEHGSSAYMVPKWRYQEFINSNMP